MIVIQRYTSRLLQRVSSQWHVTTTTTTQQKQRRHFFLHTCECVSLSARVPAQSHVFTAARKRTEQNNSQKKQHLTSPAGNTLYSAVLKQRHNKIHFSEKTKS